MSAYIISKDRASFVEKHFFEWSFNLPEDSLPDKELFLKLTHPAELHLLAYIYNWDDGPVVLEWILDSPLCTKATANLIFWRSAPDYYLRFDLEGDPKARPSEAAVLSLLRKIVRRHENNSFHELEIDFDPTEELEDIDTEEPKWTIPGAVYDRIHGVEIQLAN